MPFKLDKFSSLSLVTITPKLFKTDSDKKTENIVSIPSEPKNIFDELFSKRKDEKYPTAFVPEDSQQTLHKSKKYRSKHRSSVAEIIPPYNHSKITSIHQEEEFLIEINATLDSLKDIRQQSFKCIDMNSNAKNLKLQIDIAFLMFDVKIDDYNKDISSYSSTSNVCEYQHYLSALSAKNEYLKTTFKLISIDMDKLNYIEHMLYPTKTNFLDYQNSIQDFYKLLDTIDEIFSEIDTQFLVSQYRNPLALKALNVLAEQIKKNKFEYKSAFGKLNIAPIQPPTEKDFTQLANLALEVKTFASEVQHKTKCLQTLLNCHLLHQQNLIRATFIDQIFGIAIPALKNALSSVTDKSNDLFQQFHTLSIQSDAFCIPELSLQTLSEDQVFNLDCLTQSKKQQKQLKATLKDKFNFALELIQLIKTHQYNLLNAPVKFKVVDDTEIQGTVKELLALCNSRMSLDIGLTSTTKNAAWLSRIQDCLIYDFQLDTFDEQFKYHLLNLLSLGFIKNKEYKSKFLIELENFAFEMHQNFKKFSNENPNITIHGQEFIFNNVHYVMNFDVQQHIVNYQKIKNLICKNYVEGLNRDQNNELIRYIPMLTDFNNSKALILENMEQQNKQIQIKAFQFKKQTDIYFQNVNLILADIDNFFISEHLHKNTEDFLKELRGDFINYKCKLDKIRQNFQLNFPCEQHSSITEYAKYLHANNKNLNLLNTTIFNDIKYKLTNFKPHPNLEKILHWLDTIVFKFLTLIVRNEPSRQTPGLFSKSIDKDFNLLRDTLSEKIQKLNLSLSAPAA